jgi:hypothetical protein
MVNYHLIIGILFIFIFGPYITFVIAVVLILRLATVSCLSNLPPESALIQAELNYQEANMDLKIQQLLIASQGQTVEQLIEQFAGFIMGTHIGLFILSFAMNHNSILSSLCRVYSAVSAFITVFSAWKRSLV